MNLSTARCIVTAGPTYEAIDPVRFIGNRSSGRMGIELAYSLIKKGAQVTLILGPSSIDVATIQGLETVRVESAIDMYHAVMSRVDTMDLGIFAAAVADYRPKEVASQKIKKKENTLTIELIKNPDILGTVGQHKKANQILVGFALETNDEEENAQKKLVKKNLDLIVLNSLNDPGAGFQFDTNQVTLIDRQNNMTKIELKDKSKVADDIIHYIEIIFN